jgi:urea carboxylase
MREGFLHGKVELEVRHDKFRLRDYERFLADNRASIEGFKSTQQAAFDAERQRWIESGQLGFSEAERAASSAERAEGSVPAGAQVVESHVPGSVWKLMVERGARVSKGDALLVVESMKMEVCVEAPEDGTVLELLVSEGKAVSPGQQVAFLRPEAP